MMNAQNALGEVGERYRHLAPLPPKSLLNYFHTWSSTGNLLALLSS